MYVVSHFVKLHRLQHSWTFATFGTKKHSITFDSFTKNQNTNANEQQKHPSTSSTSPNEQQSSSSLVQNQPKSTSSALSKQQQSIERFLIRSSREEYIARIIAKDGINSNKIANCEALRHSFRTIFNAELPQYSNKLMDMMNNFFNVAKKATIEKIKKLKRDGLRVSATLDEWTSCRNRRYVNVNIHAHDGETINLGLIRIEKNAPAEIIHDLMCTKLNEFELTDGDLAGVTTDGARVMIKFGELTSAIHQQCYNHGIHLAVLDVLQCDLDAMEHSDNNDCESDISGNEDDDFFVEKEDEIHVRTDIKSVLEKVRKIAKMFRKSPTKTRRCKNIFVTNMTRSSI